MYKYSEIYNFILDRSIRMYDLYLPSKYAITSTIYKINQDNDIIINRDNKIILKKGNSLIQKINLQLKIDDTCPVNSSVKRIILTDDESVKFPHIIYQYKSQTTRYNSKYIYQIP
tara:strand:+ start:2063 stop:2407 length:345 start_codon:yes stop_codon:yes gene_type:complete